MPVRGLLLRQHLTRWFLETGPETRSVPLPDRFQKAGVASPLPPGPSPNLPPTAHRGAGDSRGRVEGLPTCRPPARHPAKHPCPLATCAQHGKLQPPQYLSLLTRASSVGNGGSSGGRGRGLFKPTEKKLLWVSGPLTVCWSVLNKTITPGPTPLTMGRSDSQPATGRSDLQP